MLLRRKLFPVDDDLRTPVEPGLVGVAVISNGIVAAIGLSLHQFGRDATAVHIIQHHFGPFPGEYIVVLIGADRVGVAFYLHGKLRAALEVANHLVDAAESMGVEAIVVEFEIDDKTQDGFSVEGVDVVVIVVEVVETE